MKINRRLVRDYFAPEAEYDEAFRRWYVARVLTGGGIDDVRALGFETIRAYLPQIVLPHCVREFWNWYFGLTKPDGDPDRGA